ncbi:MAG: AIM24 family protein [Candidatus Azobacteroides sp.]|nr:AIM24 family protein [Candidatus Azobacteroides sp.]
MNCKVIGYDMKSLEVELQPGESFFCEKGAIIYHEGGIEKNVRVLNKGITDMLKRKLSGESIFLVELTNKLYKPQKLMLAGKIGMLPLDLKQFPNGIICRKGYYIASTKELDMDFSLNLSSLVSGTGLIMQKISGNGTVFLDSFGSAILLNVENNDSVYVDEKSFICMDANAQSRMGADFSAKGLLGGEGLTMFRIQGPASVYVNSVNV